MSPFKKSDIIISGDNFGTIINNIKVYLFSVDIADFQVELKVIHLENDRIKIESPGG